MNVPLVFALLAFLAATAGCKTTSQSRKFHTENDPKVISEMRQLTFEGARSGEGYFSPDGQWMIFQSERDSKNPFYQIYLMDLTTGQTKRVSSGIGKTTCSWIHPDKKKALFASTHLDADVKKKAQQEWEERKSPNKSNYSWSYDETYDLFSVDLNTKRSTRLTKEKGYDAEGSYSPDGQWIAFASNRNGYTDTLPEAELKLFQQDPSYMMDIYIMKSDGSEVKQLTTERGYDGGPFFSPDGAKITWRRFSPNGQTAEVFTMNIDGSNQKQITHMNVMSWAPYFHPSGDYLIFASNKEGYKNFELFIVDAEGEHEPVRVSYSDGFDGLPVFTPDGQHLAWTRRNEQGESQIYLSKWDDTKARQLLNVKKYFLPKVEPLAHSAVPDWFSVARAREWVTYLSSQSLEGRKSGSAAEKEYTEALAQEFKKLGLTPVVSEGYLQPFTFVSGVELGVANQLRIQGQMALLGTDWIPMSFSKMEMAEGPMAFVGYGIVAPATNELAAFDSYGDASVTGKWAVALADIPADVPNAKRFQLNLYSRPHHKALVARQKGALGLILVDLKDSGDMKLRFDGGDASAGLPVVRMSWKLASEMLKKSDLNLSNLKRKLDTGDALTQTELRTRVSARVDLKFIRSQAYNVLAEIRAPRAKSTVIVGAHGDHLGRGHLGSSLARDNERDKVHPGADDNASGVATVLELAKYFSDPERAKNLKTNLVFAVWSGEELGNLGSTYFGKNYKGSKLKAYVNLDMVGRLTDQLLVQGLASAKQWRSVLEPLVVKSQIPVSIQSDPYLPTDSLAFYLNEVPTLTFFTGAHSEYHSPRDVVELINFDGMSRVGGLVAQVVDTIADPGVKLDYQKVKSTQSPMSGRSFRLYLGTIPDYSQEGIKGVKISGTTKDSPAEKAGLKAGDIIIELGETKINNLYDYVYCLQAMKANEKTTVKVRRQDRLVELEITPQLKGM